MNLRLSLKVRLCSKMIANHKKNAHGSKYDYLAFFAIFSKTDIFMIFMNIVPLYHGHVDIQSVQTSGIMYFQKPKTFFCQLWRGLAHASKFQPPQPQKY